MASPVWDTADLELRARERADMVNSTFVSSDEAQRFLENGWQELSGILMTDNPKALRFTYDATTQAGTPTVPLAAPAVLPYNIRRLHGVQVRSPVDRRYFLRPLELRELEAVSPTTDTSQPLYYEFWAGPDGQNLTLAPYPDAAYILRIHYTPVLALTDVETFGLPAADYTQYVVLCAAIAMKDKEESDVTVLVGEKAQLLATMRAGWQPDDTSEAQRVVQIGAMTSRRTPVTSRDPEPEEFFG
jgi:hypothetical protein